MNDSEGSPSSVLEEEYMTEAFPHEDGILWVTHKVRVEYSFKWHRNNDEPVEIPWPMLEITRTLIDRDGMAHRSTSFVAGCDVLREVRSGEAYSERAFFSGPDDTDVVVLTALTDFHCDSRDMLMFLLHEESWTDAPRFVAHFDKYSGGEMRLVMNGRLMFLEVRMAHFDDRVTGDHIELGGPVYFSIDLDRWRNHHHAQDVQQYIDRYESYILEPGPQVPLVFSRGTGGGEPQPTVQLLEEPWTVKRSRELMAEEIRRLGESG